MTGPTRIVDAHHHLWRLGGAIGYPWLEARGERRFFGDPAPIQRDYLVPDLRADAAGLPLIASVHIQVGVAPGDELAESAWAAAQQAATGLPSAAIAFCDLTAPDCAAQLDAQLAVGMVRGIRQIVGRSAREDAATGSGALLTDPRFRAGLAAVAARGLSFDLQLVPGQMAAAAALLAELPGLPVALCHAGSLQDFSAAGRAEWRAGIAALAALPQLICKFSGLGMFAPDWTAATARDQFGVVLDAFGPDRLAFGSNFPVEKLASSYASVWARYGELAARLTAAERDALFAGTAARFYRIALPAAPDAETA